MNFRNIDTLSYPYKAQIQNVIDIFKEELIGSLAGIYAHGSLCLESFLEEKSDIDILVVSDRKLPPEDRLDIARKLMDIQFKPAPLELSVIYTGHLKPWHHPVPCQFHISEYHHATYLDLIKNNELNHWLLTDEFPDPDNACHVTLTRQSGICLYGKPVLELFPEVPEKDFWDSITNDLEDYDFNAYGQHYFTSNILILCRIWSYKEERRILSKYEAGLWAINRVPQSVRYIVENALKSRFGLEPQMTYDPSDLQKLKTYLIERINEGI